ncbi:S-adenosyl-L-methionine dependent methyltransferase [Ganoderma leucocontextum]|nr:S-adenosyl-L-methionine dependent methyltransferase [Ganoderma leucocontextum]
MEPSASIYTTFTLRLYDFIVLVFSNALAWRCSTRSTLLPFYEKHTKESSAHLEVGSGTGYYPSTAASSGALSKTRLITLCDLNPNTLIYSKNRLASAGYKGSIEMLEHNIFEPLAQDMRGKYDSIALYYLFHCLPQSFPQKGTAVFANVAPALAPNGVLYGATILGKGVAHNWLGSWLMGQYNSKGIFGNTGDSEEGLRQALGEVFEECAVTVVGVVAMFEARKLRALKK